MGIHQLSKVIAENCPNAVKTSDLKSFTGCKLAIDASMSIYQFLIAVRLEGNVLTNDEGETTSHLMGIFYRTLRMIDNGIKPIYVFDGKPPSMKSGELIKRTERREDAEKKLNVAEKEEDTENIEKFSKRLVKVLPQHNEECKQLLLLMGIPFVNAPCEAEAQCSALVKAGKAYAVGTEDMDALTFGGNILLRHLTFSEARKMPIQEYHLDKILDQLELTMAQFIDLCILLGCDYCPSIRGIGPKKAIDLIKKHGSIEAVIDKLDQTKYPLPVDWNYVGARALFTNPDVTDPVDIELKWKLPQEEALVKFLCEKNNFNEERIRSAIKRLVKARTTSIQCRIDGFFTKPIEDNTQKKQPQKKTEMKRKGPTILEKGGNKKSKKVMKPK